LFIKTDDERNTLTALFIPCVEVLCNIEYYNVCFV